MSRFFLLFAFPLAAACSFVPLYETPWPTPNEHHAVVTPG